MRRVWSGVRVQVLAVDPCRWTRRRWPCAVAAQHATRDDPGRWRACGGEATDGGRNAQADSQARRSHHGGGTATQPHGRRCGSGRKLCLLLERSTAAERQSSHGRGLTQTRVIVNMYMLWYGTWSDTLRGLQS